MNVSNTPDELQRWLVHIQSVHFRSIDMSLERVAAVLNRVAVKLPFRIIAVAGTNGKGSCAAMLGSLLAAHGCRVGVYSSPHLVRFNERIRAAGADVEDEVLCRVFEQIESARGDIPLTYFEFATLAAVLVFQRARVDYAVMEVGMGGRLDAVNALPIDAALLTNVGLDHTQWLGRDREAIGREKAPIMRAGKATVYNDPTPVQTVLDYAERIGAPLLLAGRDYHYQAADTGWRWRGPQGEDWHLPDPAVPGAVQRQNAAGALALLSGMGPPLALDEHAVSRGLSGTRLRGRCEIVGRRPMVVVDVAHNVPAIRVFKQQLESQPVGGRTIAVFGMLKDKDPAAVVNALDGIVDAWHLAGIDDPRGQSAAELAEAIETLTVSRPCCHDTVIQAYEYARQHASPDDRIIVFGSFHIAGDILAHLKTLS